MPLPSGHQLGAYEIVCPLGAGGMGEVYRARDARLGRDVALKVLPPEVVNEPGRLERFDREARAVAALNHPHIVTIFSTEEAGGVRFLTMELVDGCTLSDLVMPGGMAMPRFLDIAIPLADALAAAHQKQITHRDLKPGNVMVSNDGRVKVLDFGLARVGGADASEQTLIATQAPITNQGTIIGTMPYMSPEQVEGRPLDPRSDLFSLGVIFHELLSGERPFKGSSSPALMSAILRDTPASVAERRADVPAALDRLLARLLEKRPDDRVQTARDVYNELRHIQRSSDPSTRPTSKTESGSLRASGALASIAVLPFADLSEKKDQDWFCDGIAEEILNALAPLPGLRVAARTSAFSFRGKSDDLRAIADKLQVTTVLEGSVRRAGDRVRITTQLSDAREGRQLWSERFDREVKDIFDVQEEIARAIADRLRVTLGGGRLVERATSNIEAYQLLLKGRMLLTRRGRAIFEAIPCFERVIALDPGISDAHALLGDAHRLIGLYGLRAAHETMPLARASVERALAIDPNQVEALATLANLAQIYEWDFAAGIALSARALAINPDHVRALAERAITLSVTDPLPAAMLDEALSGMARARTLDPLNAWVVATEAFGFAFGGRPEQAVANAIEAVALDPSNFTAHWALVWTQAWVGRLAEVRSAATTALAMSGRHPMILAELAAIESLHGDRSAAGSIFEELEERARSTYIGFACRAAAAASAGRLDTARALIKEAITARDSYLTLWKLPAWRPFWQDAECAATLRATSLFER